MAISCLSQISALHSANVANPVWPQAKALYREVTSTVMRKLWPHCTSSVIPLYLKAIWKHYFDCIPNFSKNSCFYLNI